MWSMKWQIRIRTTVFALMTLALVLGWILDTADRLPIRPVDFKIRLTWVIMWSDYYPWTFHLLLFSLAFGLLYVGFPSILALMYLTLVWGPVWGFMGTLACHLLSFFLILKRDRQRIIDQQMLDPDLLKLVENTTLSGSQMSFFPRLFLGLPLRTVDLMVNVARTPEDTLPRIILLSMGSMGLRLLIQVVWFTSFTGMVIGFTPFPEKDVALFLFSSALLMVLSLWPKIPELVPGKPKLPEFFTTLTGESQIQKTNTIKS